MATVVTEISSSRIVAHGANIAVQSGHPPTYLVARIDPYPNAGLVVGNKYTIADTTHQLAVELLHAPGGGMQTATFR